MRSSRLLRPLALLGGLAGAVSAAAAPAWVATSDGDAQVLLQSIARFRPEEASGWGLAAYDARVQDAAPDVNARFRAALAASRAALQRDLASETNPRVREDLAIMIRAADLRIQGLELDDRALLPYAPVAKAIFQGEFVLLSDQVAPERRAAALPRLERYTGLAPGSVPLASLARARYEERSRQAGLLPPFRGEVDQDLADSSRYVDGVRKLFAKYQVAGGEAALSALDRQMRDYADWVRAVVLPRARTDFRMPPELYAYDLRQVGLDISPADLIQRAEFAFSEVTNELQSLAPLVARERGWPETDYRAVIARLKREQLPNAEIEPYYRTVVIPRIEALIRENRVATLPDRPMAMRIASEAESAVQPAPHMTAPPLINNRGERGTFVLTLGNPPTGAGKVEGYDDFTFKAATWTLTAHEGRPGHELQFSRMVEQGVSQARSIFAFNSVNVEGWALYCEAEMKPYEPLDAQLIVLQLRLLRAVRAFVDPMLNLGLMTRDRAHEILVRDVGLSEAFAREELDRFTYRSPGQATAYFYGYARLMELRAATQVALGDRFDRLAFNDFIVSQGLLPPDLLASAVQGEFIPQAGAAAAEPTFSADRIRERTRVLSSDEFEGRAPATPGEDKTIAYVTGEFKKIGLAPGNPNGTYRQDVPMVGITSRPSLSFAVGGRTIALEPINDYVAYSLRTAPHVEVRDSDVVFVGYGVVAPEFAWDDFKGVDVRGKTVIMLINDPPVRDPHDPTKLDPKVFGGEAMTYYGRWTYKFDMASARGAAACLIVHETGPAGYPFGVLVGSNTRENFDLRRADGNRAQVAVQAWLTLSAAKALFAATGHDFAALKAAAAQRDFHPVELNARANLTVENTVRAVASRNVVARLGGSDPALRDETVVYSAHWDHLGRDPRLKGDQIYNGAADNASGTAVLLEIAQAYAALPADARPKRSVLFLSVTAEEKGLLGSRFYAENPLYPLRQTLADINLDIANVVGPSRDLEVIGYGNTTIDDLAKAILARSGRVMTPDSEPGKGHFYRSDHFEFAKVGVPSFYTQPGIDIIGQPAGYGQRKRDEYVALYYHKVGDEIQPWWDFRGAAEDARFFFDLGREIADGSTWPAWRPGNEFKAKRDAMLAAPP